MGRGAAPFCLPWVPGTRLPRPAPLFPRSGRGQSRAAVTRCPYRGRGAQDPRCSRSHPAPRSLLPRSLAPPSAAGPDLPFPLRQLRGGGAR